MPRFIHGAHGLIERGDDRYLVVRRSPDDDYMPGKWELPGGQITETESLEQALTREVLEETGLVVDQYELLNVFTNYNSSTNLQGVSFIYLCEKFTGTVELSDEHSGFRWVNAMEICELDAVWWLKQLRELYMG